MAVDMLATWWVGEAFGEAAPFAVLRREVRWPPGRRDCLARIRSTAMKTAPSAPVVSAWSRLTPWPFGVRSSAIVMYRKEKS